mgnify:CR=1 FL=1
MEKVLKPEGINFEKSGGLVPAVTVDHLSLQVLMTGFMNREALDKTLETGKVTFFSRIKGRLWTKGETSGNFLTVKGITPDCDNDTLLVKVSPAGPVCHTGTHTCFEEGEARPFNFLSDLFDLIEARKKEMPEGSYTTKLFSQGSDRIIQKVGEEAVEVVIAAKNRDKNEVINESADLLFHLLVMLSEQGIDPAEVVETLISRHNK